MTKEAGSAEESGEALLVRQVKQILGPSTTDEPFEEDQAADPEDQAPGDAAAFDDEAQDPVPSPHRDEVVAHEVGEYEQTPEAIDADAIVLDEPPAVRAGRRSGPGTLTVMLLVALGLAAGFFGGVQAQKAKAPISIGEPGNVTGRGGEREGAGANAAAGPAEGAGAGGPTFGDIKLVDQGNIYVTTPQGSIVKVTTSSSTKFSKQADAGVQDMKPGDRVLVQGITGPDGTVAANTVTDSGAPTP